MLSWIIPASRWKVALWLAFLFLVIALRWFGASLIAARGNPSPQLPCVATTAPGPYTMCSR